MHLPPPDLPPPSLPVPEIKPSVIKAEETPLIPVNPYTPPKAELREEPDDDAKLELAAADWTGVVKEALLYPLRDDNWMGILVAGGVMLFVYLAQWVPAAGIAVFLGGSAYIASYYFEIVQHTIKGRSDMPAWPELSCWWDDILIPGVQMLGVSLLSLLPMVLIHWLMNEDEHAGAFLFAQIGALAFAAAYFPMAALSVVCVGTLNAALPHQVLPAILRCLPGYGLCVIVFAVMEASRQIAQLILGPVPVLGFLLPALVGVYGWFVQARLTGLIYLRSSEKLPW